MKNLFYKLSTTFCVLLMSLVLVTGCNKNTYNDPHKKDLMLYLALDEGSGDIVKDSSNHLEDAKLQYIFNNAQYKESEDSQWRSNGIQGGSLLFDGYSNFVRYSEEEFCYGGSNLSISCWVAPRAFEWDDPNGEKNGNDTLTAIVSQFNKETCEGFVLGYQRHGRFSFQLGIGDAWLTLWCNEGVYLEKYEWNHIVATFDGLDGRMRLYLNGELVGEDLSYEGIKVAPCWSEPLLIGKNSDPGSNATASLNMVSGLMDEIKIYNTTLDEKAVSKYYKFYNVPEIEFEDIWLQNILTDDIHKTQFHGGPYQHWMNEPHAPAYYNGYYHLFFQFNLFGPYFRNICWGHLVSTDMVNWKPLKEVITPTAGSVCPDGVWSGGITYDSKGVPVIFFTAGNDSYSKDGLISNQNIGIARPKDPTDPYLTEWVVDDELAIKQKSGQGVSGQFRDAHVWQEGDTWCMLIGSASTTTNGGTALLYTTKDDGFHNWDYKGQLYEMKNQSGDLGSVWELPVLLPIKSDDGTKSKYLFIISPAPADTADNDIYYWIGDFNLNTGRFTPDASFGANPRLFDYGNNVFTGPSGFIDPVSKKTVIFSIMQDQRKPGDVYYSGWANCVGLAREVYLNDEGTDACIRAIDALDNYHKEVLLDINNKTLSEANNALKDVKGDMLYIRYEATNVNASSFGIKVRKNDTTYEETILYYQTSNNTIGIKTGLSGKQNISGNFFGNLELDENNKLVMEIYIDRSLIEAFFNEQKAISARVYPDKTSLGIQLFSENGEVHVDSLYIASMKSIYEGEQ